VRFLNRSAGRISRHRRGPLAGLLVLLLGLMLTGGLYAVFSPAVSCSW
jgi:ubiquinol-cytochrome c reductase cytochrome c subunit